jgi:SAM-dependent methyltransferase
MLQARSMDLAEARAGGVRHPWEVARYEFFRRVLREGAVDVPGTAILDVGAGDAWFARRLAESAPGISVLCWDQGYGADRVAGTEGALRFSADRPSETFDAVLLLDVLEHVERDAEFLATIVSSNLRPGGAVLFSVPAWQPLFSSHDVRLKHVRRYAPSRAREVLAGAGLEIARSGGLFHSLLPARALQVAAERARLARRQRDAGEWGGPAALTRIVGTALAWDTALSLAASARGWNLPGLSWWALCRRRS